MLSRKAQAGQTDAGHTLPYRQPSVWSTAQRLATFFDMTEGAFIDAARAWAHGTAPEAIAPGAPLAPSENVEHFVFVMRLALPLLEERSLTRDAVERLNAYANAFLKSPTTVKHFAGMGSIAFPTTPEQLGSFAEAETRRWARIVEYAKIERQ